MKLINRFRNDKVEVEIKQARGVKLKQITYTSYSGKIKLDKTDSIIGAQRNKLLCSDKLSFPAESGYRRFYSTDFTKRLCTNMSLSVLQEFKYPEKIRVGIYDPDGDSHDILLHILKICSDVTVVTNNGDSYRCELERAMDELGATAVITKNIDDLSDCEFIIAPCVIDEKLPIRNYTIVMTLENPKVPISGFIYYKYYLKMPNGFDSLKPKELEEDYFCSALYTLAFQYELGSIVPTLCRNSSTSQTVKSLCASLEASTTK